MQKLNLTTRILATLCRRLRGRRGVGRIQKFVAKRLPPSGTAVAGFGKGRKLACDMAVGYDRSIYLGREEVRELQLLRALLASGDTFVDCGANLGLFTVFGAERVGPRGIVYAIEPVPSTFRRLTENVDLSHVGGRVRAVNKALDAENDATVSLTGSEHNIMRIGGDHDLGELRATTVTLDSLLTDCPSVSGIKVDVEGYELNALHGGLDTLRRFSPWILIEFNSGIVGTNDLAQWDVHAFLKDCGYEAHLPASWLASNFEPLRDGWTNPRNYTNVLYTVRRAT